MFATLSKRLDTVECTIEANGEQLAKLDRQLARLDELALITRPAEQWLASIRTALTHESYQKLMALLGDAVIITKPDIAEALAEMGRG